MVRRKFGTGLSLLWLLMTGLALWAGGIMLADAQPTSNIRMTKHNLSKTGPGTVRATVEDQVCVFCHIPHAATAGPYPLWNRALNQPTAYTGYTSLSMDADAGKFKSDNTAGRPKGPSVLCLSCHDGTLALGKVGVLEANTNVTISMAGTEADGTMPAGAGAGTGFTRRLGTDLSNDHPISIPYTAALAAADGELRAPGVGGSPVDVRGPGKQPHLPLVPIDGVAMVQCSSCHDPHLFDPSDPNRKFLRANRTQKAEPTGNTFNAATDIICLGCHDKDVGVGEWAKSVHANGAANTITYKAAEATRREFPAGATVMQASCLNCHDTHTVAGARRLLREGTDGPLLNGHKNAGSSAIEETCFQCHNSATGAVVNTGTLSSSAGVPDIKTEFGRLYRMPITTGDQGTGGRTSENHDIQDKDFTESTDKMGRTAAGSADHGARHAECTDCHNPHRAIKNSRYDGTGDPNRRSHVPGTSGPGGREGNVASGVLRGAWGVEPTYAVTTTSRWNPGYDNTNPVPEVTGYAVVKGIPGKDPSPLTKEYQLCFKCHSNYSNANAADQFPTLGGTGGKTAAGTNSAQRYTNVAAEFAARATYPVATTGTDQGEGGGDAALTPLGSTGGQTLPAAQANNHRSWHPVLYPTGRNRAERRMPATGNINLLAPFAANIGTVTMQCSDCHGETLSYASGVGPDLTKVQGPHGSDSPFILKGSWDLNVRLPSPAPTSLCGKCHNNAYSSGFAGNHRPDDKMGGEACMYCHIAVPHGWKNKAFLVNLQCVGYEVAGSTSNCQNRGAGNYGSTTLPPYYNAARLRVYTWVQSGGWSSAACGGAAMEDVCPRTGG